MDESEYNLNIKDTNKEMDMEEKKNKMMYDDWLYIFFFIILIYQWMGLLIFLVGTWIYEWIL